LVKRHTEQSWMMKWLPSLGRQSIVHFLTKILVLFHVCELRCHFPC
jgi:hypothetical protein